MEWMIKIILLLVFGLVIAGVLWDMKRSKHPKRREFFVNRHEPRLEEFEEIVAFTPEQKMGVNEVFKFEDKEEIESNEVIALYLMARQPEVFSLENLLQAFREAFLFYGEMEIFHRYENTDGTGKSLFCVASVIEPGSFAISKLEKFTTPGIALFFTLGKMNQSIAAFELMLRTAKQLAMLLEGDLKDDTHQLLTDKRIERYREQVRRTYTRSGRASLS